MAVEKVKIPLFNITSGISEDKEISAKNSN